MGARNVGERGSLEVILSGDKITISGFNMGEALSYAEKLWNFLREIVDSHYHDKVLVEVTALGTLEELSFEWGVSLEFDFTSLEESQLIKLYEYIVWKLEEENFLVDGRVEVF